ncbi:MAG TPA: bifunctional hydroxymethylpyrimidine kinase/phosphomethylpyrimidine kinase [Verrucomicrobiae bacterium]
MTTPNTIPCALTIAGSDSGGGAGIQADLQTFAALGVHGTSAITCITAQNPRRVLGIQPCSAAIVQKQIDAVFSELEPAAVKTGMLYSASLIKAVSHSLRRFRPVVVVDPVMVSTSGAQLLRPAAVKVLCSELLPLAALVTPNLQEAEILTGRRLRSVENLREAARTLHEWFGCAALVKGGHLRGGREAVDIFYDGREELLLSAPFVRGVSTHGTGCTYSAAVTGFLALGLKLPRSVREAKNFITRAIARSRVTAKHWILNWSGC